jgi:UDP-2-acetamido-3-amino-2,3-dideoxy-glucuronate N-acetyltransferase
MELDNSKITVAGVKLIPIQKNSDPRGNLLAFEADQNLPFKVKRIFMVNSVPSDQIRGIHAHRECWQFLVAVAGSITVSFDDGITSQELVLDRDDYGLLMPPLTYGRQFNYSQDAVLLVLTSHAYDASDYIDDYEEFLQIKNISKK